jgi:hypothetical protein
MEHTTARQQRAANNITDSMNTAQHRQIIHKKPMTFPVVLTLLE